LKDNIEINQLVEHFFRHESGKMVSVLTKIFGSQNLDLAEDVVQDSLIEAISQWQFKGVPDNPSAWLFRVAKNKALNIVNREKYKRQYSKEASHFLHSEWTAAPASCDHFSESEIQDDQLRMIFTCCHHAISPDSQIALALKTLCGFSIPEIAKAFLTNAENINKRLVRARLKIREEKIPFEVPHGKDLEKRLQTVLEAIYLLFNEGYSASTGTDLIRYEICEEAIRLTEIISSNTAIRSQSDVYALLALMQLNASRFKARQDILGNIITLEKQNRSQWNYSLIEKGFSNLEKSTSASPISIYHVLATISAYHCSAADYGSTDWKSILALYDKLTQIENSPIVLLNRTIALSRVVGVEKAIIELEQIENIAFLKSYYLFYSVQAEFYMELNQFPKAISILETAIDLAPLKTEKTLLREKLAFCLEKKL
jgi:RNA polymerase sigma factor (sigma-70 family)